MDLRHAAAIGFAAVLLSTLKSAAVPQPAPPTSRPAVGAAADTPDEAAARAAAKAFTEALGDPDVARAKTLFAGSPADFRLVQLHHTAVRAAARLEAAAAKAFPVEAKGLPANDLNVAEMVKRVERTPVFVLGDEARAGGDGLRLRRVGGRWQVVDLFANPRDKAYYPKIIVPMTKAMADTAAEAERGKYRTLADMGKAMTARAEAALAANPPPQR